MFLIIPFLQQSDFFHIIPFRSLCPGPQNDNFVSIFLFLTTNRTRNRSVSVRRKKTSSFLNLRIFLCLSWRWWRRQFDFYFSRRNVRRRRRRSKHTANEELHTLCICCRHLCLSFSLARRPGDGGLWYVFEEKDGIQLLGMLGDLNFVEMTGYWRKIGKFTVSAPGKLMDGLLTWGGKLYNSLHVNRQWILQN